MTENQKTPEATYNDIVSMMETLKESGAYGPFIAPTTPPLPDCAEDKWCRCPSCTSILVNMIADTTAYLKGLDAAEKAVKSFAKMVVVNPVEKSKKPVDFQKFLKTLCHRRKK